jgi:hypothetical protein
VQDNLRTWKTGGLRRISDDEPFRDLVYSSPARKPERELAPHPSLKPQHLLRQLVRAALPLGEGVILDPFMGSGSTIATASACGLRSIGLEINQGYFELATAAIPALARLKLNGEGQSALQGGFRRSGPAARGARPRRHPARHRVHRARIDTAQQRFPDLRRRGTGNSTNPQHCLESKTSKRPWAIQSHYDHAGWYVIWRYLVDATQILEPGKPVVVWRVDVVYLEKTDWKYEKSGAGTSGGGRTHTFGVKSAAQKLNPIFDSCVYELSA